MREATDGAGGAAEIGENMKLVFLEGGHKYHLSSILQARLSVMFFTSHNLKCLEIVFC